jgi:glycosyltransferase involved in cell wall biosynthesis
LSRTVDNALRTARRSPHIWLLQDGEPLPIDESPRLMRTGNLAPRLVAAGFLVTWWTSRFNHGLKKYRHGSGGFTDVGDRYRLRMLDGPSYTRNLSLRRMRHYRSLAAQFSRLADSVERPDLILASFPSPELAFAGMRFARRHGVPFIVDIRDPWPDIFSAYFHPFASWALAPIVSYYRRMTRAIMQSADNILAVSESMLKWGIDYAGRERKAGDAVFFIGYNKQPAERQIVVPDRFTEANPLICLFATTCGNSYDGGTVVEAARILEASGERRVSFVVSGDGECREKWMARASGLQTVRFTGWISHEELQELFFTAHVGLILMHGGITPFWLGNKFAEYLSTYLALINNVAGESAGIVDSRKIGLNVPAKNPQAVADAVRTLLDSPETVRHAMTSSRTVFNDVFERGRIYDSYVQYLSNCVTRRDASSTE